MKRPVAEETDKAEADRKVDGRGAERRPSRVLVATCGHHSEQVKGDVHKRCLARVTKTQNRQHRDVVRARTMRAVALRRLSSRARSHLRRHQG